MARKHNKRGVFQPVDVWTAALLTVPDAQFFELARSTLGEIYAPFSKQRLIEDLCAFLSREDVLKNIRAYIDEADHKVIAAIALLSEPEQKELEVFFAKEFSPSRLGVIMLNLEERLIVFRRTIQTGARINRVISLNPMLENALAPFIADLSVVFPARQITEEESRALAARNRTEPSPAFVAALFAYIENEGDIFKTTGEFRKKVYSETRWVFGQYDVEKWIHIFMRLNVLCERQPGVLYVDWDNAASFAAASERDRRVHIACAVYMNQISGNWSKHDYTLQQRQNRFVSFFTSLLRVLERGKCYTENALMRRVQVMENDPHWLSYEAADRIKVDIMLSALEEAGLLAKTGTDYTPIIPPPPHQENAHIVFDSSLTFYMLPEITFADALKTASFCSLSGIENAPSIEEREAREEDGRPRAGGETRFEVSRDAVVKAFERGFDNQAIYAHLKRLSDGKVSESLEWNLNEWKTRYQEAALFEGITIFLAPERRYIAEVEPLSSMIQETIAPGVFILSTKDRETALRALHKAGVEIVRAPRVRPPLWEREETASFLQGLDSQPTEEAGVLEAASYGDMEERKNEFRALLAAREGALTKNEHDELASRIERRLIVAGEQLTITQWHLEKLEARGLDFSGKANVVRTAMSKNSLLEITISVEGKPKTLIGEPKSIEKTNGEQTLVFLGIDGASLRMPLGKISVVRRLKNSIFE